MLRPLFSASHSAHLENRARETVTEHPALVRWNRQMGVPGAAFGAIWGPQAEIWETDAVYAPSDSEDEARTTTTTQEHELDKRARRGSHGSHAPSINSHPDETIPPPPSQPLPPSSMANKTRLWVSAWSVGAYHDFQSHLDTLLQVLDLNSSHLLGCRILFLQVRPSLD